MIARQEIINSDLSRLKAKADQYTWLLGSWTRTNGSQDNHTMEHWSRESEYTYVGYAYTVQAGDTIFFEDLAMTFGLKKSEYVVSGPNEGLTTFELINFSKTTLEFHNQFNEYPQTISYNKTLEGMHATISGGGPVVTFEYKSSSN